MLLLEAWGYRAGTLKFSFFAQNALTGNACAICQISNFDAIVERGGLLGRFSASADEFQRLYFFFHRHCLFFIGTVVLLFS